MLTFRKVAVTGGLSCGKSSVCRFFKEFGALVVIADEIVHQLLTPTTFLGKQVIALFGDEILKNGKIDRSFIAKKVFNNKTQLQSLEKLVHPAVFSEIDKQYELAKEQNRFSLFIAEIPLLFEAGCEDNYDAVIAVRSNPENCKRRFKLATGYDEREYDRRSSFQMAPEEKVRRADFVIENNSDIEHLHDQTKQLYLRLTRS